jgi:serine/threonine protein kinase
VAQTKKQMTVNCTPEVEDLFKKIFDLDPDNRITFSDIRRHPVFAKHFPVVAEASKILYSKKFQPSKIIKKSFINKLPSKKSDEEEDNIRGTMSVIRKKDKEFPEEKDILERKKDEIDFLRDNADEFLDLRDILKPHERLMLSYNLLKYYIVLLRAFRDGLNKNDLTQRYPGLKWQEVLTTKQFKEFYKDVDESLNQATVKLANLFDQCRGCIKEI